MKIDFASSFKGVSALIRSSARPPEVSGTDSGFGRILADISPDRTPSAEITPKVGATETPSGKTFNFDEEPKASLNPAAPELRAMTLTPSLGTLPSGEDGRIESEGVKTPTLLGIRRVAVNKRVSEGRVKDGVSEIKALISDAGRRSGIDPALGISVAEAESSLIRMP